MRSEADRLLEDLDYIRSNVGTVGPDHPRVKKWVAEFRSYLSREGQTKDVRRFEQLGFVKGGSEMWSHYEIRQRNIPKYKAELDKVAGILEGLGGISRSSGSSSADEQMRELFFTSPEESASEEPVPEETAPEEPTAEETEIEEEGGFLEEPPPVEKTMDERIEPNFEVITKKHLSVTAREEAVDRLMADLNAEMKSSDPDWERIHGIMGDLMGLKKTGELLDRLKTEVKDPEARWETVRALLAQLWSIKKEIVVDLLPTLLKW